MKGNTNNIMKDYNNQRYYRNWINNNHLKKFHISYKETDLLIRAPQRLPDFSLQVVKKLRKKLDSYIKNNQTFLKTLNPVKSDNTAPPEIKKMIKSSIKVNTGPMAAVAGLFAEKVGKTILKKNNQHKEVIVENGGDIFLSLKNDPIIGVYAGKKSPFTNTLGIKIAADLTPLGICTSAGTVGPSLSKGKSDAVIVVSPKPTLADAAATALGNKIQTEKDIKQAINYGQKIDDIIGLVIIKNDKIGAWGKLELVNLSD